MEELGDNDQVAISPPTQSSQQLKNPLKDATNKHGQSNSQTYAQSNLVGADPESAYQSA